MVLRDSGRQVIILSAGFSFKIPDETFLRLLAALTGKMLEFSKIAMVSCSFGQEFLQPILALFQLLHKIILIL